MQRTVLLSFRVSTDGQFKQISDLSLPARISIPDRRSLFKPRLTNETAALSLRSEQLRSEQQTVRGYIRSSAISQMRGIAFDRVINDGESNQKTIYITNRLTDGGQLPYSWAQHTTLGTQKTSHGILLLHSKECYSSRSHIFLGIPVRD